METLLHAAAAVVDRRDGQRLLVAVHADADGELDWLVAAMDPTVIRAHQHAAGLRLGKTTAAAW